MAKGIDLKSMGKFLDSVDWPITAGDLAKKAETAKLPESDLIFLQDIDEDLELPSKEEVMTRAEEVSILMEEEPDTPQQEPRSPQDIV